MSQRKPRDAKSYTHQKYALSLLETAYLLILLFVFSVSGSSRALARAIAQMGANDYSPLLFLLAISLGYYILSFPITVYRSFLLERRFGLSKMKFGDWAFDQLKSGIISYILVLILVSAFYTLLNRYPHSWWIYTSLFWIIFSFLLAQLAPVLIIPLFYKYKPLTDEVLRKRIILLGEKMRVKFLDVYELQMSSKTEKANAAFAGWGPTKRVLLADTLQRKYTPEEIETVVAHEFAHYKHNHLLKLLAIHAALTAVLMYVIFVFSGRALTRFGYDSLRQVAAMPLLFLFFQVFTLITQPAHAFLSRRMERDADRAALAATGNKQAFISTMEKLGTQNLADTHPHPLIKFFFFDHPPIAERIAMAQEQT